MNSENKILYLNYAHEVAALNSDDPNTNVGAILVRPNTDKFGYDNIISTGYNGFPVGIKYLTDRTQKEVKGEWFSHAERMCIEYAARRGKETKDSIMFCPYFCCTECAKSIINAGISHVVGDRLLHTLTPERWKKSIAFAHSLLTEAGVTYEFLKSPDIQRHKSRFDGKVLTDGIGQQIEVSHSLNGG